MTKMLGHHHNAPCKQLPACHAAQHFSRNAGMGASIGCHGCVLGLAHVLPWLLCRHWFAGWNARVAEKSLARTACAGQHTHTGLTVQPWAPFEGLQKNSMPNHTSSDKSRPKNYGLQQVNVRRPLFPLLQQAWVGSLSLYYVFGNHFLHTWALCYDLMSLYIYIFIYICMYNIYGYISLSASKHCDKKFLVILTTDFIANGD